MTSEHSNLGRMAKEYRGVYVDRVTKEMDILNDKFYRELVVQTERRVGIRLHVSLPCTVWSPWQTMAIHKYGPGYAWDLRLRRERSRRMVRRFITLAEIVLKNGGEVSFEWPRYCTGWRLPELVRFIAKWKLYTVAVDGCATGLVDKSGVPIKKPWQFITSCQRQVVSLWMLRCSHGPDFKYAPAEG